MIVLLSLGCILHLQCEMQNSIGSKPDLVLAGQELDEENKSCCLGSYNSVGDIISDEVVSSIQNARLAFTNMRHL